MINLKILLEKFVTHLCYRTKKHLILSIKSVKNVNEAVSHILKYGTMHTDCIISNNKCYLMSFIKPTNIKQFNEVFPVKACKNTHLFNSLSIY